MGHQRKKRHSCNRRSAVACMLLAGAIGCGGDAKVAVHPVEGKVVLNGDPVPGALVVFHSERPREEIQGLPIPRATTDAEGKFRLSSFAGTDGAPEGSYKVTVYIPEPSTDSEEASLQSPPRVDRRYADPATSGLSATIDSGTTKLPVFELK